MEDMARLAVFEQNVRDLEVFNKTLLKLSRYIQCILENPHDNNLRCIESETIAKSLQVATFTDYLVYVGFQIKDNKLVYPNESSINKLRMSLSAIQRKLRFSNGTAETNETENIKPTKSVMKLQEVKLLPVDESVLNTNNEFLKQILHMFNDVLKYEDPELQREAREHIPLVTLELKAIDRMRDHQRKIKAGSTNEPDMPYDTALLMELLLWFKYQFFTWVDAPACDRCGGKTELSGVTTARTGTETCRVELYSCPCGGGARFPRLNDPRALLAARRGRCGEWAGCFALLCRALGRDARRVYDFSDHVWCEVYDWSSRRWLHADPCEARLDAPLLYARGWGKALAHVVAASRDDVQDVTWRYTTDHAVVRARRARSARCPEGALAAALQALRTARRAPLPPARRDHLARRDLRELLDMMLEREPTDAETHGRISGSRAWRTQRGEAGAGGHTFEFHLPGEHCVTYSAAADRYVVSHEGRDVSSVQGWEAGAFAASHVFRKEEPDWRMVYLAREEGEREGSVSWRVAGGARRLTALAVSAAAAEYHDSRVEWTLSFDDEPPVRVHVDAKTPACYCRVFSRVVLAATLRGGGGALAWQHAQLFRQPAGDAAAALTITVTAAAD